MAQNNPKSITTILLGMLLGAAVFSIFATIQFVAVYGQIVAKNYIVPITVGITVGALLAFWYHKLRLANQQLKENHDVLSLVLDGTGLGIWDWYLQTNEVYFDERWCQLIGYQKWELENTFKTWEERAHPDDLPQVYKDIRDHIDGKTDFYSNIHRMKHKHGHWVYILDRGRIIERDKHGQPLRFTGIHADISHLKEVEKKLEQSNAKLKQLSFQDGLTRLQNRRALDEFMLHQWGHWQRNQTPFSILMVDIDFFKQFNDFYGHLDGDLCLKQIAALLDQTFKRSNDIVVRYGGEEFLIVLTSVEADKAENMAESLRQSVEQLGIRHESSGVADVVTVSIGVSSCDKAHCCESFLEPIDFADQALYLAKKRGRNQIAVSNLTYDEKAPPPN